MSRHNQSTAAQIKRIVFQWAWLLALALLALRGPGDVAVDAKVSRKRNMLQFVLCYILSNIHVYVVFRSLILKLLK